MCGFITAAILDGRLDMNHPYLKYDHLSLTKKKYLVLIYNRNYFSKESYYRLDTKKIEKTHFYDCPEIFSALRNTRIESVMDETCGSASNLLKIKKPSTEFVLLQEKSRDGWILLLLLVMGLLISVNMLTLFGIWQRLVEEYSKDFLVGFGLSRYTKGAF
ncbi:hypothetical protein BD770DRAFT_407065 [Pilaira anomala]|nr:hypothetical protein BD770DRAFT_407065 [Pilaira anomala]